MSTQLDENIHGVYISDPAQNGQIHGTRCSQILIFEFQLFSYHWDILKNLMSGIQI